MPVMPGMLGPRACLLSEQEIMTMLLFCVLITSALWIGALSDGSSDDDHGLPHALAYNSDTFNEAISQQPHFIMFYAPWFVSIFLTCGLIGNVLGVEFDYHTELRHRLKFGILCRPSF